MWLSVPTAHSSGNVLLHSKSAILPHHYRTCLPNNRRRLQAQPLSIEKRILLSVVNSVTSQSSASVSETSQQHASWNHIIHTAEKLNLMADAKSRIKFILNHGKHLPALSDSQKVKDHRVMGCVAQVWVIAAIDSNGLLSLAADSDSDISRGLCAILLSAFHGRHPEELLEFPVSGLNQLSDAIGYGIQQPSRSNGLYSILQAMQKRARLALQSNSGSPVLDPFPSLLIKWDGSIEAQGEFAVAQSTYLNPNRSQVTRLAALLAEKQIGVVAHFYMDPEVQGVLVAAQELWPHIHISDSLVMADRALAMAAAGCKRIAVLGVDFMAENVRAIMDGGGFKQVPVLRMSPDAIGCSLAEAAESEAYVEYLEEAGRTEQSLHVIYINTSLETKARAHSLLPTITCTSSNVVQTVLQAFAQVPELTLWYGPDTYMGGNLVDLITQLGQLPDEEVRKVHPLHSRKSVRDILPRLRYFQDGSCMVHDLFGHEVVQRVRQGYGDAYQTAHFEVPGEMFALAMEARRYGRGTIGSTQNILDFIGLRTREAVDRGVSDRLQFVLGTESGMITSIVNQVREILAAQKEEGTVEVEIVFPVDSSAVARTDVDLPQGLAPLAGLPIVPGVQSGEGCSVSGGCASCPYMKMNSLDALLRVSALVGTAGEYLLEGYHPRMFSGTVAGRSVADIGCDPILHMRHFQKHGSLSEELVNDIRWRQRQPVDPSLP